MLRTSVFLSVNWVSPGPQEVERGRAEVLDSALVVGVWSLGGLCDRRQGRKGPGSRKTSARPRGRPGSPSAGPGGPSLDAYSLSTSCALPINLSASPSPPDLCVGCFVHQECPFPQLLHYLVSPQITFQCNHIVPLPGRALAPSLSSRALGSIV